MDLGEGDVDHHPVVRAKDLEGRGPADDVLIDVRVEARFELQVRVHGEPELPARDLKVSRATRAQQIGRARVVVREDVLIVKKLGFLVGSPAVSFAQHGNYLLGTLGLLGGAQAPEGIYRTCGRPALRIVEGESRKLQGEYWTDRKTTGDIEVKFRSSVLKHSFE